MSGKPDKDASGDGRNYTASRPDGFPETYVPTPEEARARRRRNIAIASAIGVFSVFFYAIPIAKLGVGVIERPL